MQPGYPFPKTQLTCMLHAGAQQGLHENWPVRSCVQEPHKRTSCQESTASLCHLVPGVPCQKRSCEIRETSFLETVSEGLALFGLVEVACRFSWEVRSGLPNSRCCFLSLHVLAVLLHRLWGCQSPRPAMFLALSSPDLSVPTHSVRKVCLERPTSDSTASGRLSRVR